MTPTMMVFLAILFVFFLVWNYFTPKDNNIFLIFAFIICIIMAYELFNTGIEFSGGANTTISKLNDTYTQANTQLTYQPVNRFWVNSLGIIIILIALLLLWIITAGGELAHG